MANLKKEKKEETKIENSTVTEPTKNKTLKKPKAIKAGVESAVKPDSSQITVSSKPETSLDNTLDTTKKIKKSQKIKAELKKSESLKTDTKPDKKQKADEESDSDEKLPFRERFYYWFVGLFKKKQDEIPTPNAKRIKADPKVGLTLEQVQDRSEKGFTNKVVNNTTKTYNAIFFGNIFTFFNLLSLGVFIALIISKAQFTQLLFMFIIVANLLIGIAQEIKAKKTIERLSLLTAPTTTVLRSGKEFNISTDEVVLDDIIILGVGKQIVADCIVLEGTCEVNESLLTGESLPIKKKVGSTLLSGSFVSSGTIKARVVRIGKDSYVEQLTSKAKKYKKPKSELFNSLNSIIKVIGFIIIPLSVGMIISNYNSTLNAQDTIQLTAGSIVGMIPAGMFLLSSIALTVSVIRLAQRKALVQDLYCVEMLARVNVLCLDKTGTITDGSMKVYNCIELQNKSGFTLKRIMGSMLSSLKDNNQTSQALINYFGYNKELRPLSTIPFSSSRKFSAVSFEGNGTFILGAPEFVIPNQKDEKIQNMIEQYSKDGYRVLMLAYSSGYIKRNELPSLTKTPIAVLILEDRIRDDAIETIQWFKENDVKIKIISGDNPMTVAEIAKRVGVDDTESFINLEGMNENQVRNAANKYTVFGRVSPDQKAILIRSIKAQGNCVAMTGDGVNDILALKEADCSIAMASGSDAVRSVSHMVLLDSNFSSMPQTVKEGRRVINNVQKSSALFFMKTIFTIVFSIIILMLSTKNPTQYPLKTSNLILLEYFVIGIPSFFLALQPNNNRVSGKFIYNLFKNALPGAITLIINAIAIYLFVSLTRGTLSDTELLTSMMTITLTFTGLALLSKLCKPMTALTGTLFASMLITCMMLLIFTPDLFGVGVIDLQNVLFLIILSITSTYMVNFLYKIFDRVNFEPDQIKNKLKR